MSYAKKQLIVSFVLMTLFSGLEMSLCAMNLGRAMEGASPETRLVGELAFEQLRVNLAGQGEQVMAECDQKMDEEGAAAKQSSMLEAIRGTRAQAPYVANAAPAVNNPDEPRTKCLSTPLMEAARDGDKEKVKSLIEQKADVNARGADGFTPLIYAAGNGHKDIVEMLLGAGANANARTHNGSTALTRASSKRMFEVVECLLQHDPTQNVDVRGENGATALMQIVATKNKQELRDSNLCLVPEDWSNDKRIATAKALLDSSAHVDVRATMLSCDQSQRLSVRDIMVFDEERGVDSRPIKNLLRDERGVRDAKPFANVMKRIEKKEESQQACIDAIKDCVRSGSVSVDGISSGCYRSVTDDATLLTRAAECGKASVVEFLIRQGAHLHDGNVLGDTALILAARNGHFITVETLLNLGAKAQIDACNKEGGTALIEAARAGHLTIVKLLVEKGADTRIAMHHSMITPFIGAAWGKHCDVARYLMEEVGVQIPEEELLHAFIWAKNGEKKCASYADLAKEIRKQNVPWCGNSECSQINSKKYCSQCNLKKYCSRECQVADWKNHKIRCGALMGLAVIQQAFAEVPGCMASCNPDSADFEEQSKEAGVLNANTMAVLAAMDAQVAAEARLSGDVCNAAEETKPGAVLPAAKQPQASQQKVQKKPAATPSAGEIDYGWQVSVAPASDRVGKPKKGPKQAPNRAQDWEYWDNKQQLGKDKQGKNNGRSKGAKQQVANTKPRSSNSRNQTGGPVCAPQGPLTREEKEIVRARQQQTPSKPDHLSHSFLQELNAAKDRKEERLERERKEREESQCAREQEQAALPELDFNEQQDGDLGPGFLTVGKEVIAFKARHVFEGESGNRGLHHDYGLKREHAGDVVRLDNDHTFDEDANGCYRVTRNGEKKSMFPSSWTEKELKSRLQRALGGHGRCFSLPSKKRAGVMEVFGVMEASQGGETLFAPVYFKAITERRGVIGRPEVTCVITTVFPIAREKFNKKYAEWGEAQELEAAIKMSLQDTSAELRDESAAAAVQ